LAKPGRIRGLVFACSPRHLLNMLPANEVAGFRYSRAVVKSTVAEIEAHSRSFAQARRRAEPWRLSK
jgi:hypothetical protein